MTNQTERADDLLPCPMCEKDARVFKVGKNYLDKQLYEVRCKRDRCQIGTTPHVSKAKAIRIWNTRSKGTQEGDQKRGEAWPLSHDLDQIERPMAEAVEFKWHHVLVGNPGYKFEDFSKETWGALPVAVIEKLRQGARLSLSQPSIPPGHALVPIKPTEEMLKEGSKYMCFHEEGQINEDAGLTYKAMIAAAPKQEKSE